MSATFPYPVSAQPARSEASTATAERKVQARWGDTAFEWTTRLFALLVLGILLAILVSLVVGSTLTLGKYGIAFLWSPAWDPVREEFGALVPIYGTVMTSLIAMLIAVPVSFGIALFLTELAPAWLKRPLGTAIELLAAIPSIIYRVRSPVPGVPAAVHDRNAG